MIEWLIGDLDTTATSDALTYAAYLVAMSASVWWRS